MITFYITKRQNYNDFKNQCKRNKYSIIQHFTQNTLYLGFCIINPDLCACLAQVLILCMRTTREHRHLVHVHTHSCTQWTFDKSYVFLIALLMHPLHPPTHTFTKSNVPKSPCGKEPSDFMATYICCSILRSSLAWKSSIIVIFSTAIFENVMYWDVSDINACDTCHYLVHSWLRNARPLSNFSLKCAHGWKSSAYPA